MAGIDASIVIERPRQEVFDFLLDLEHTAGIDPGIVSIEKTSQGPIGPGTTFEVRQKAPPFGRVASGTSTFTVVDPPRSLAIAARLGPIEPTGRFEFEEVANGTRVTVAIDPNAVGLFRLLSGLIGRQARRIWLARMERMKTILESESG